MQWLAAWYDGGMTTASISSAPAHHAPVPLAQDAKIIGLVGLAHAVSHFSHLLLVPLFPVFKQEFGLSYSELGMLMTVFFVISGIGQALSGFLVDKVGARPVLFTAVFIFLLASIVAGSATSYGWLIAAAALAGLGNAPFHPCDFTILNQRVSLPRLGHAYSAHGLTGNLGWALAPVFYVSITALSNWRTAFMVATVLYAFVLLILWINRDSLLTQVVVHTEHATEKPSNTAFLKMPVVWWCFAFFLLSTMTLAVIQSFSVSILKAMHGVSFEAASATLTAYMLCGAVGIFVGGFVAAKQKNSDKTVAATMVAGAVLLALCATGWLGATGTMVVLAGTGFAIGIGNPSRDMMIKKATPKGATGRVYGTVYSGLDVGFAVSPLIFGRLMDQGLYAACLYGAAIILLVSVGAALGVGMRTRNANA